MIKAGLDFGNSKISCVVADYKNSTNIDLCILGMNFESEKKILIKYEPFLKNGGKFMIVDVRTYNIIPRKMKTYLNLFEQYALPIQRRHLGDPLGYITSIIEIGLQRKELQKLLIGEIRKILKFYENTF